MLFFVQSLSLVDSLALSSRPAEELRQELLRLLRPAENRSPDSTRQHRELAGFVIAQITNDYGRSDVVDLLVSKEASGPEFWLLCRPLCDALPVLHLGVEEFAVMLGRLADRVGGDWAGGMICSAASHLGRLRPDFAFKLVDQLAAAKGEATIGLLQSVMTGIARSSSDDFDAVVARCQTWLGSGQGELCQAAVYCSQNLASDGKLDPDWLLSRIDPLISNSDGVRYSLSIVVTIIGASFKGHSEECLSILRRLKERGPEDRVAYGIASTLSNSAVEIALDYRLSCLFLLADVPIADMGTIREIREVLSPITFSHPESVWAYAESWILRHEREKSIVKHDMFLSTIQHTYRHNPAIGRQVLTRWFASSDLRLVEEARSVIRGLKIGDFDAGVINSMSSQHMMYITEKLLVGHLPIVQWMSLFSSILKNTSEIEGLTGYFSRALGHLTWNYPGGAAEFLNRAIDEKDTSRPSVILREAREKIKEYRAAREGVCVPELSPSRRRAKKYLELERKKMQAVQEAVIDGDRFPLQKLMTRVAVARGDRTFHMNMLHPDPTQRRTFTEPRGFGEFSESFELPRGETIDPEGELWARIRRLNYRLGESRDNHE